MANPLREQPKTGLGTSAVDPRVTAGKPISVKEFLRVIRRLPTDKPIDNPSVWYRTQKEHLIGWLEQHDGAGAYGRKIDVKRDARFVYNHIVCPQMLLWLSRASGVPSELTQAAMGESGMATSLQQKAATIRRYVPWEMMADALWRPSDKSPLGLFAGLINRI